LKIAYASAELNVPKVQHCELKTYSSSTLQMMKMHLQCAAELLGSLTRKPQNANQSPFCMNRHEKLDYQLATNAISISLSLFYKQRSKMFRLFVYDDRTCDGYKEGMLNFVFTSL